MQFSSRDTRHQKKKRQKETKTRHKKSSVLLPEEAGNAVSVGFLSHVLFQTSVKQYCPLITAAGPK